MLKKELLEIICCPVDHADLEYNSTKNTLTCKKCGKIYRVQDDIPIMLVDDDAKIE